MYSLLLSLPLLSIVKLSPTITPPNVDEVAVVNDKEIDEVAPL